MKTHYQLTEILRKIQEAIIATPRTHTVVMGRWVRRMIKVCDALREAPYTEPEPLTVGDVVLINTEWVESPDYAKVIFENNKQIMSRKKVNLFGKSVTANQKQIWQILNDSEEPLQNFEIAKRIGCNTSSSYGGLGNLIKLGFVHQKKEGGKTWYSTKVMDGMQMELPLLVPSKPKFEPIQTYQATKVRGSWVRFINDERRILRRNPGTIITSTKVDQRTGIVTVELRAA